MIPQNFFSSLLTASVFSLLGFGFFLFSFYLFDKLTPFDLRKELIEEHNTSLAIVVGAVALGICLIVAAAIHG